MQRGRKSLGLFYSSCFAEQKKEKTCRKQPLEESEISLVRMRSDAARGAFCLVPRASRSDQWRPRAAPPSPPCRDDDCSQSVIFFFLLASWLSHHLSFKMCLTNETDTLHARPARRQPRKMMHIGLAFPSLSLGKWYSPFVWYLLRSLHKKNEENIIVCANTNTHKKLWNVQVEQICSKILFQIFPSCHHWHKACL